MQVFVKKKHEDAVVPYKTYDDDFCYDCVAISCEEVAPNVYKYGIGLAFAINEGEKPVFVAKVDAVSGIMSVEPSIVSLDFRPRSSIWKTGMVLSNAVGTIDSLYRGEVSAVFYHVLPSMPRYQIGDRIGQIKLGLTLPIKFIEANILPTTTRGEGGYGSTGR